MSRIRQPRTQGSLGIIGATGLEIGPLRKRVELIERERVGSSRFFRGRLYGKELIVAQSGVGYGCAADACMHMIERFSPLAILSLGFAGSVDTNTKIGNLLLVTHLLWIKDMESLQVEETYTLDKGLIDITSNLLNKHGVEFTMGRVLTVPHYVFKLDERHRIRRALKVKAVEMEGAATASQTRKHGVPLMALRLISDDMSTREIDYGMMVSPMGRPTLSGALRFSLAHRGDLLEILRFGRQVRRLGTRLSRIGARIVEEITFLPPDPVREMDLHGFRKNEPDSFFRPTMMGNGDT